MKSLSKQQQKVYDYIKRNPGCTTYEIRRDTFVSCPTGRMSEMRSLGIVFKEVGERKYPGSQPFKMYAIQDPKAAAAVAREELSAKTVAITL